MRSCGGQCLKAIANAPRIDAQVTDPEPADRARIDAGVTAAICRYGSDYHVVMKADVRDTDRRLDMTMHRLGKRYRTQVSISGGMKLPPVIEAANACEIVRAQCQRCVVWRIGKIIRDVVKGRGVTCRQCTTGEEAP